jgi:hypothetical protein
MRQKKVFALNPAIEQVPEPIPPVRDKCNKTDLLFIKEPDQIVVLVIIFKNMERYFPFGDDPLQHL